MTKQRNEAQPSLAAQRFCDSLDDCRVLQLISSTQNKVHTLQLFLVLAPTGKTKCQFVIIKK